MLRRMRLRIYERKQVSQWGTKSLAMCSLSRRLLYLLSPGRSINLPQLQQLLKQNIPVANQQSINNWILHDSLQGGIRVHTQSIYKCHIFCLCPLPCHLPRVHPTPERIVLHSLPWRFLPPALAYSKRQ